MSTALVDLRFSDVAPPNAEPMRRIYCDIVDLPDPLEMGLGVRIFNLDSVSLYMKVDASADDWTFIEKQLGSLGAGSSFYRNLLSFGTRPRPGVPTQETLEVTLYAYTDAGYSNLKWSRTRNITVEYIKSDDGTWSWDVINNFDDGTVQDWGVYNVPCGYLGTFTVATDYVLSFPFSLKWTCEHTHTPSTNEKYFHKSFNTPVKDTVFMIANYRIDHSYASDLGIYVEVNGEKVLVCKLDAANDLWMRLVVPLPSGASGVMIRIGQTYWNGPIDIAKMWLDDFMIISR